jgi:hypothetical protein
MSPLSNRTMNLVSLAALLALAGCQSAPEAAQEDGSFEALASSRFLRAPALEVPVRAGGHELAEPVYRPLPSSVLRRVAEEPRAISASEGVASLGASVAVSRVLRSDSPAVVALGTSAASSPPVLTAIQPGSPAVRALASVEASPQLTVPFVVECASDADCMIDVCDVTSCVPEASLLAREGICAAEAPTEATEQDGCLCQAGRCGWAAQPSSREGI